MKLLVFGGAFDPPHAGHRELLKVAAEKTEADEILVIPTALPPHKKEKPLFLIVLKWPNLLSEIWLG